MSADHRHASTHLEQILRSRDPNELSRQLMPKTDNHAPHVPGGTHVSPEVLDRRWQLLNAVPEVQENLLDERTLSQAEVYRHNIENFVGTVKVPLGLAGPLRVNGLFAQGDYYLPLATTEAALVASYHRGCQLVTAAGGCTAMLLNEGVGRAPGFAFADLADAGAFVAWALTQLD